MLASEASWSVIESGANKSNLDSRGWTDITKKQQLLRPSQTQSATRKDQTDSLSKDNLQTITQQI